MEFLKKEWNQGRVVRDNQPSLVQKFVVDHRVSHMSLPFLENVLLYLLDESVVLNLFLQLFQG